MMSFRSLIVAVTVCVLVCGCGTTGGGSSTVTGGAHARSTKTAASVESGFPAEADPICERMYREYSKFKIGTQKQMAAVGPQVTTFENRSLAELDKLVPPASVEAAWKQMIAAAHTLAHKNAEIFQYAARGKLETKAALAVILAGEKIRKQALAVAARAGFHDCSRFI